MKKYWHVIGIGVQNNLTYRFNFLARTLFGFIPLAAILLLWRTIYAGKVSDETVGGFTLAQMTSYYLLVTIVDALTAAQELCERGDGEQPDGFRGYHRQEIPTFRGSSLTPHKAKGGGA